MRTKEFVSRLDHDRIVKAIAAAEANTSGEIRVYIKRGEIADVLSAASKQFEKLGMTKTRARNGVLIFVAPRAQKFAVVGDRGVHEKCGDEYWKELVNSMQQHFRGENFTDALVHGIKETGELLAAHFPRRPDDRDELPNKIEES